MMVGMGRETGQAGVAGVILAGGKSSRFGSNKALALHQACPLIQGIAARITPLFSETLLVTNTPELYAFLGWPMAGDLYPGCGPLAGIHAALKTIKSPRAFVCACDMPLIEAKLIRFLAELPDEADLLLPWTGQGPEPLCAIYRKSALPVIEEHLREGKCKLGALYERLSIRRVSEEEILAVVPDLTAFANVNRCHELEALAGKEGLRP